MQSGGVPGKNPEDMSAVRIYIVTASSLLWFRKRQVHRIRWIVHAPNSWMLAVISKYAIDARIGGWFKPTYLELNQTHLTISTHIWRTRDINWEMGWSWSPLHMTPPKVVHCDSSSSIWAVTAWHNIAGVLKNLAELRRRIELGPCWVATLEVAWVQT